MSAIHLVDDRRMGGVTRFLEQLTALCPQDRIEHVRRGTMRARVYPADVIVSHLAISWRSLPMMIALRACNPGARIIHVEHSYCEGFERHRVPKQRRFRTLLRTAYALFDEVICVSEGQAAWMQRAEVVPQGKQRIAPPLVDLGPFAELPSVQFGETRRFGFVGRLDEQKGIDIVIAAFLSRRPKNATLEIFGDGPMREKLEEMAAGESSIRFHGRIENPAHAYQHFEIAVMPSRWEPYGLSCLEARAAGCPVITSGVDGLTEQTRSGGGIVVSNTKAGWCETLTDPFLDAGLRLQAGIGRRSALRDGEAAETLWRNLTSAPLGIHAKADAVS